MKRQITPGAKVAFDSDEGPQKGIVADIKPHIGNGQKIAIVRVEGTLCGAPWQIPVNELQQLKSAA